MASLLRSSTRPNFYICASCAFKAPKVLKTPPRRWIGIKYYKKVAEAKEAWDAKAEIIRKGEKKSMLTILEERGLVQQITGSREEVDKALTDTRIGAYIGFDPTGTSLHVGHMLPLMSLFWLYVHGYQAITLLGGATAKIGDPTDRLQSREKVHSSIRTEQMVKMHYQLKKMWINVEAYGRKYGYEWEWAWNRGLVNNTHWFNKLSLLEVLQTLGHGTRIGPMLAKDTVKNKLRKGGGMSFAEFTYPLMQAWDWWHMYIRRKVQMQIGGSDQYGNITAGIDAIKYISTNHNDPNVRKEVTVPPFGFTVPLLTTSSGEKFGKSAGNAVWLDADQTTPFELYGYFMKTSDADVGRYLKLFTFMPIEDIHNLMEEHKQEPRLRRAQHALASEFLEVVHGAQVAKSTRKEHETMFAKKREGVVEKAELGPVSPAGFNLNNAPKANVKLPQHLVFTKSIGKILHACGLASSNAEGHRLAATNGVYIGGCKRAGKMTAMDDDFISWEKIVLWYPEQTRDFLVDGKLLFLRRGKANIRIIEVVTDEEYLLSGESFPGFGRDSFFPQLDEKKFPPRRNRQADKPGSMGDPRSMKNGPPRAPGSEQRKDKHTSEGPRIHKIEGDAVLSYKPLNLSPSTQEVKGDTALSYRTSNIVSSSPLEGEEDSSEIQEDRRSLTAGLGGSPILKQKMHIPTREQIQQRRKERLKEESTGAKRDRIVMRKEKREIKMLLEKEQYRDMMRARYGEGWEEREKEAFDGGQI